MAPGRPAQRLAAGWLSGKGEPLVRDEAFRADLREDVAAGIADGTIRTDVALDEVAVAVVGQLRGIGLQRLLDSPAVDTERLRRSVTEHWRRALVPA